MSLVYAKLKNQFNFKYQLTFLFLFSKYGEYIQIISGKELPITLSITHNLTQSEIDDNSIQWSSENRVQSVEKQKSG